MIFLLRSRHLGSPVQSSLEPCCTAGTTPSCAGAARFNVRRRAAAMWHRNIGWFVRLPQSPRGREARTLSNNIQAAHLRALSISRQLDAWCLVHGSWHTWCQGKDAHAWRACCCSTAPPRGSVAHRRRRAPTRTATASSGRRWASARTTRASCVLQCGKQARTRPSGSLEASLQCHGVPQAGRSRLAGAPASLGQSAVRSWQYRQTGPVFDTGTSRAPSLAARARSSVRAGGGTSAATSARTRTSRATSPPSWSASSRGLSWDRRLGLGLGLGLG